MCLKVISFYDLPYSRGKRFPSRTHIDRYNLKTQKGKNTHLFRCFINVGIVYVYANILPKDCCLAYTLVLKYLQYNFDTFLIFTSLFPKLYTRRLYSKALANFHLKNLLWSVYATVAFKWTYLRCDVLLFLCLKWRFRQLSHSGSGLSQELLWWFGLLTEFWVTMTLAWELPTYPLSLFVRSLSRSCADVILFYPLVSNSLNDKRCSRRTSTSWAIAYTNACGVSLLKVLLEMQMP